MKAFKTPKFLIVFVLILLLLIIPACGLGKGSEPAFDYRFVLMSDYNLFFNISFSEDVKDFSLECYDPSTGTSWFIYDETDIEAPYFNSIGIAQGWIWQPGQEIYMTASGMDPITIQIPYAGTAEWDQFLYDASNIPSLDDSTSSDDSPSLNELLVQQHNCEKAQENLASCQEQYNNADDPVNQMLWANTCNDIQTQVNQFCQ